MTGEFRAFMVSRLPDFHLFPGAGFCLVKDTLSGLQELASARRQAFKGYVAAISGSNGKTIVKEWIFHCLNDPFSVHRSPKSYNSQVGVPLSVWMMGDNHDLAVIEAGISQPGEMEKLQKIIQPQIGLFTNLGSAHQENFNSLGREINGEDCCFFGIVIRSSAVRIRLLDQVHSYPIWKDLKAEIVRLEPGRRSHLSIY